jgi:hypothetical protein
LNEMRRRGGTAARNDEGVLYFGYGSTMADLKEQPEEAEFLGSARLPDHRLAFTRDSRTWQAGAADVVPAPGMFVWGALYRVSRRFLEETLDPREGAGFAYRRVEVGVDQGGRESSAFTYVVLEKVDPELLPSEEYVAKVIEGAKASALPETYISFLESLRDQPPGAFRHGYFALPTATRREAAGMGLLRVAPEVAAELGLKRLAAVRHGARVCTAKVHRIPGIAPDACEVDQNVRHALGIVGYETYGATVTLHPVGAPRFRLVRPLIQPRMLFLRLQRPRWMDSEKSICVLHEKNIRLLGLTEGDYIDVFFTAEPATGAQLATAASNGSESAYQIRSGSFRVFSGSAENQPRDGKTIEYPRIDEVYLDADGRTQIGVPSGLVDVPVMVGPDLGRLFSSRLLFYGATVFLAGAALWPLVEQAASELALTKSVALLVTVMLSFGLTAVFALFDIRGRVRY